MNVHRVPDLDEAVGWWGAWMIGALVAAFTFGYACARNNGPVIVLALIVVFACSFEARRLHQRDVDEARSCTRTLARLRDHR